MARDANRQFCPIKEVFVRRVFSFCIAHIGGEKPTCSRICARFGQISRPISLTLSKPYEIGQPETELNSYRDDGS